VKSRIGLRFELFFPPKLIIVPIVKIGEGTKFSINNLKKQIMNQTNDFYYLKRENGYEIYDRVTNHYFGREITKKSADKMIENLNDLRRNFILMNV
jgi:hypothetical protein